MDAIVNNQNWQALASSLEADRGLQPGLLRGIAMNETAGGHPAIINQTSPAGAQGMFQFMPATAQQYNVNVRDSADSTRGAADYLGDLTKKYSDPLLAGAAYNMGQGNLDHAIAAARANSAPTDAMSLAQNGYLPHETAGYVTKLAGNLAQAAPAQPQGPQPYSPDVVDATRQAVAQMTQQGMSPVNIVTQLAKSPVSSMINQMTGAGLSADDIVSQVGGAPLQAIKDAQAKVGAQGFGTNLWQGVKSAGHDLSVGAQQVGDTITGNDADLQSLNAAQAAREADPTYQAQQGTVGSQVGNFGVKALPYVAAAALPELSVPAMIGTQAAIGGTMGALKPTTADGQRLGNIGTEAGLAGAGAGAGALLGKGSSMLATKLLGSSADGQASARIAADAQAQGLPVNAATLSGQNGFWRNIADSMPQNGSVSGFQAQADKAVAGKVAEGLGLQGYDGPINTDMLNAARPAIKQALDDATNVQVVLPQSLKGDLQALTTGAQNPLTEGIATNSIVNTAAKNLSAAVDSGAPVAGKQLQDLASELKAVASNPSASSTERQVAGQMVGQVNNALTSAMTPEQSAAFSAANQQYAAMKAVEKMVSASGDTGVVSPRQMINAVKSGRFKSQFYNGDAPFQDLAGTAADLYGPAAGKGLGAMLANATGGDHSLAAAAILEPSIGVPTLLAKKLGSTLLGKLATSQNPTLVRLLSGQAGVSPELAQYVSRALGGTGAATVAQ